MSTQHQQHIHHVGWTKLLVSIYMNPSSKQNRATSADLNLKRSWWNSRFLEVGEFHDLTWRTKICHQNRRIKKHQSASILQYTVLWAQEDSWLRSKAQLREAEAEAKIGMRLIQGGPHFSGTVTVIFNGGFTTWVLKKGTFPSGFAIDVSLLGVIVCDFSQHHAFWRFIYTGCFCQVL